MDSKPSPAPRRFGWPQAFVLAVLIVAVLIGFSLWKLFALPSEAARGAAEEVRRAFVELLQVEPKIVINERTFFNQTTNIAELATTSSLVTVERDTTDQWWGSTKKLHLRGTFEAKAGFDLNELFVVQIEEGDPRTLRLRLPPAKILSLDQQEISVLNSTSGIWNKLSPEDVAAGANALADSAKLKAESSPLLQEARESLLERLQKLLGPSYKIVLIEEKTLH